MQLYSHEFPFKFRTRGGKCSGLINAEISKKYRESITEIKKKEKEQIRKQSWKQNLKKNPAKYDKYLENERLQKNYSKLMKSQKPVASSPLSSQSPEVLGIRASEEVSG